MIGSTISFLGRIDGEAFEGGTAEDVPLELGSGQFIPGFEDQVVGAKAGDEIVVKVTFPETYGVADPRRQAGGVRREGGEHRDVEGSGDRR